jgi:IS5 family transposase
MFGTVKANLKWQVLAIKQGTITDATLIAVLSSTKNNAGEWDPEMHQTNKGK